MAGAAAAGLVQTFIHADSEDRQQERAGAQPNIVFVFADQWRAQASGYNGDVNAHTPNLDNLAKESIQLTHAISGQPVCSPYRGSLMTGQYPLTHGVFMNDVCLNPEATTLAKVLKQAGYDTAYIGKWHLDGHGRSSYIPPERHQGFDYWRVLECTHNYNDSLYYADDDPTPRKWEGYDAIAQTRDAQQYIRQHGKGKPFALVLSWGPPHDPYQTAPEKYRAMFDPEKLVLRDNVPDDFSKEAREMLAGYYAHCAVLDECVGDLLATIDEIGIADNTIFVFTSDHGDLLGSHRQRNKQQPYAESIRVPFLIRYPKMLKKTGWKYEALFNAPDIMPTLLGLAGVEVPGTVQGTDYSAAMRAGETPNVESALIMCPAPFGQWIRTRGGREYRGVYTGRYTYTRGLEGPWQLFDNDKDPFQMNNLIDDALYTDVREHLDGLLKQWLEKVKDEFKPAAEHLADWGYEVDETGTVPYKQ